jgi:hypothetical protein
VIAQGQKKDMAASVRQRLHSETRASSAPFFTPAKSECMI